MLIAVELVLAKHVCDRAYATFCCELLHPQVTQERSIVDARRSDNRDVRVDEGVR
jgi:hypothetical protein